MRRLRILNVSVLPTSFMEVSKVNHRQEHIPTELSKGIITEVAGSNPVTNTGDIISPPKSICWCSSTEERRFFSKSFCGVDKLDKGDRQTDQ